MKRGRYIPSAKRMQVPRVVGNPEPGFFRMRLVKGGPSVAARIRHEPSRDPLTNESMDRSWFWSAEVNGETVGRAMPTPDDWVERIWTSGERISESEYWDMRDAEFSNTETRNPQEPVDLRRSKPIF